VHSEVGNTCVGAKINGRIVPLRYVLRNGDIVDILTQSGHLPSKDWLAIVKTSRARNKIKHVINAKRARARHRDRPEVSRKGSAPARRAAGAHPEERARTRGRRVRLGKVEDLYAQLGYGKFSARQVLQKSAPEQVVEEPPAPPVVEQAAPGRVRTTTRSSRSTVLTT
jgi:guanosine-3',5'-bis(diphosphate) 3'-pyrophosphohydrolase